MIRLQGKSAIITGGARGIGLATAHRLAREGVGVTLWDIDLAGLRLAQAGLRVRIERCDITDAEAVSQAAARA